MIESYLKTASTGIRMQPCECMKIHFSRIEADSSPEAGTGSSDVDGASRDKVMKFNKIHGLLVGIGLFLNCSVSVQGEEFQRIQNSFLSNGVTAHRGNSGEYPENTLSAFRSAIELGADWIELDIFLSRDGQLVVIHDKTTARVGDKDLNVMHSSYADLLRVDVATDFRRRTGQTIEQCPAARIPLLKDVLLLVKQQSQTRVSIQPKMDCVGEAIGLVKSLQAEAWVGFNDGNLAYMKEVKRLAPLIPVFWDRGGQADIRTDVSIARQNGFEAIVLHHSGVTEENVQWIRNAGLEAGAWTVNEPALMNQLRSQGIQRLYTDDPRLLFMQWKCGNQ